MNLKPPTSYKELMGMFSPENFGKMFDPEQFGAAFKFPTAPGADFQTLIESNRKNFEAMVAANTAATAVYKEFYEMQMRIFQEMVQTAQDGMPKFGGEQDPAAATKQADVMGKAFEKAFALMTEFANASRKANEEAFAIIKARIAEASEEFKGGS